MSTPPAPPTNGPQEGAGDPGKAPETQPPAADPSAPQTGTEGTGSKAPKFEGDFDPAKAARLVENLRNEVETERTKRSALETQFSDFMTKFGALFGGDAKKELTPEQIAQQAEQSAAQAREASVKLAVFRSAGKHGGDPEALLDSAAFAKAISGLDPSADTFAANVEAAIKKAVEANPRLKADTGPVVPPKGGFDMNGGSSGQRQLTAAEVEHLSKTNPRALVKAREDGLLKDYLNS